MSFTDTTPCTSADDFLAQTLKNKNDPEICEHFGVIAKCSECNLVKKAGLTLFKFFPKKGKTHWKNDVLSCIHMNWDCDPGCNCCHTIRDGEIVCGNCAGWDIMEGSVTKDMQGHSFTWADSTQSTWTKPKKPKKPKKRSYSELEVENTALKNKLAKITKLLK